MRWIISCYQLYICSHIPRELHILHPGRNTVLCQALVEVQTQGEKILQTVLAVGFAAIVGGFVAAGVMLDPIQ